MVLINELITGRSHQGELLRRLPNREESVGKCPFSLIFLLLVARVLAAS